MPPRDGRCHGWAASLGSVVSGACLYSESMDTSPPAPWDASDGALTAALPEQTRPLEHSRACGRKRRAGERAGATCAGPLEVALVSCAPSEWPPQSLACAPGSSSFLRAGAMAQVPEESVESLESLAL